MTIEGLTQRVDDLEVNTEQAHKRLRETLVDLKDQLDRIGAEQRATAHNLDTFSRMPIDATKLVLSTRSIIGLAAAVLVIAGSYWNLSSKMDAQQKAAEASQQLEALQMKALGDAVSDAKSTAADAKRQYELLRYEFQGLKDTIQKGRTK